MLEIDRAKFAGGLRPASSLPFTPRPLMDAFHVRTIWRHKRLIAAAILACLAAGLAFALLRPTTYTATAQIILDNRQLQLSQQDTMVVSNIIENPMVQSQMEVLQSEKTAMSVVKRLSLADRPEFQSHPGWIDAIKALIPRKASTGPNDPDAKDRGVAGNLTSHLELARLNGSYLIDVAYTSPDPMLSAEIANALVKAYVDDQTEANRRAAQSATAWLRERMQALGPNVQVISNASAPASPDGPGMLTILAAAFVAGATVALGLAILWEILDDRVRGPDDLSRATSAEFLGVLPRLQFAPGSQFFQRLQLPHGVMTAVSKFRKRGTAGGDSPLAVKPPSSPLRMNTEFVTTLRRVFVASVQARGIAEPVVLGITSIREGDGKTTVAANLSRIMAASGRRVLLVDCHVANARLSRILAPSTRIGLLEVLSGHAQLSQAILKDKGSTLHFLPAAAENGSTRGSEDLWLGAMPQLLETVKANYDHMILDLPPIAPSAEVRAASRYLDQLLLVMSLGTTTVKEAHGSIRSSGVNESKMFGVILNHPRHADRKLSSAKEADAASFGPAYA